MESTSFHHLISAYWSIVKRVFDTKEVFYKFITIKSMRWWWGVTKLQWEDKLLCRAHLLKVLQPFDPFTVYSTFFRSERTHIKSEIDFSFSFLSIETIFCHVKTDAQSSLTKLKQKDEKLFNTLWVQRVKNSFEFHLIFCCYLDERDAPWQFNLMKGFFSFFIIVAAFADSNSHTFGVT